ncbi:MAG: hypothetical protein EA356_11325 [Geminicoccaceae bacterium]|nr:MAG: hypothetical protein EA356_11325 [Geminicoccaceae bacterium]
MSPAWPEPASLLTLITSVRTRRSEIEAALGPAPAAGVITWVASQPTGADDVLLGHQLGPRIERIQGTTRAAWLEVVPELTTRLQHPWQQLGASERYLAGVARCLIAGGTPCVLELPGTALDGARLKALVADLTARGVGVVVVERRLRLLQALATPSWLLDRTMVAGPVPPESLLDHADAWSLCFGGTLATRGEEGVGGFGPPTTPG